jgi:uncharacterized protein YjbI with pentapeptide repeats
MVWGGLTVKALPALSKDSDVRRAPRVALFISVAVVAVGAIAAAVFLLPDYLVGSDLGGRPQNALNAAELLKAKNDVRTTLLQAVAGVILLGGAVATWRQLRLGREQLNETQRQNREQLRVSQDAQITERFTRAIDQMGSTELDIRLGGIYALERIAKDSRDDHGPVMEVLSAFLREHSGRNQETDNTDTPADALTSSRADERLRADLQAAARAIGRRNAWNDPPEGDLDLSGVRLSEAKLRDADLQKADLQKADLQKADLQEALLQEAVLNDSNLQEAILYRANLQGAALYRINLQRAHLVDANLQGANLYGANLQGASLIDANLHGANLYGANLQKASLIDANLQEANLQDANLQEAFFGATNLGAADLSSARNVTREQLETSLTDEATKLPASLAD